MIFQAISWKPVLSPSAGVQMPPALLGLRQAQLRLSAGLQGRSGISEPAGASSHPPQRTGPVPQRPTVSASGLTGRVEGKLGRAERGGACSWGQGRGNRRQRLGHITGFEGQARGAVITHSHTLTHREKDPVLTRSLQVGRSPLDQ